MSAQERSKRMADNAVMNQINAMGNEETSGVAGLSGRNGEDAWAPSGQSQEERGEAEAGVAADADGQPEEPPAALQQVRELQIQSDRLQLQLAQRDEEAQRLRNSLQDAVMKYRQALLDAHPVIPEQLLSGTTVEELEVSLERARTAVEKVRQRLEEEMSRSLSVPAGAPVRRPPDLSSLSTREKILYGLKT